MSQYSRGVVAGKETLSRFIFDPMHVKKGKITPSAYSHVFTNGCSVQREDKASNSELARFLKKFLARNPQQNWLGITHANCKQIRDIRLEGDARKVFCVYDTAEKDNPAHAEIFAARSLPEDGSQNEARALLRDAIKKAFGEDTIVSTNQYRTNQIANILSLPEESFNLSTKEGFWQKLATNARLLHLAIQEKITK